MNHLPSCACALCRTAARLGISPSEAAAGDLSELLGGEDLDRAVGLSNLSKDLAKEALLQSLYGNFFSLLSRLQNHIGHDLLPIKKGEAGFPGWKCDFDCKRCELEVLLKLAEAVED